MKEDEIGRHVVCMGRMRNAYKILVGRHGHKEDNIRIGS
jgi:hypothetical protein